jgi:hypothetical protein
MVTMFFEVNITISVECFDIIGHDGQVHRREVCVRIVHFEKWRDYFRISPTNGMQNLHTNLGSNSRDRKKIVCSKVERHEVIIFTASSSTIISFAKFNKHL